MLPLYLLVPLLGLPSSRAQQSCANYGSSAAAAAAAACACPPGFVNASSDCSLPVCGGSLGQAGLPGIAVPRTSAGFGNTSSPLCSCSDGWTGPACTVCRTSDACKNSFAYLSSAPSTSSGNSGQALNTTLTCNIDPTTYTSSQLSCNVNNPTLRSVFPLQSVLTITRTLNQEKAAWENVTSNTLGMDMGGSGSAFAQLWYDGVEQFYCKATSCNQTTSTASTSRSNSSTYTCQNMACTCIPNATFCSGTFDLTKTINGLSGQLVIDCKAEGTCTFSQSFLNKLFGPTGLAMSDCSFGECVRQYVIDQALGVINGSNTGKGNSLNAGVIAGLAVVGAILALVVAGFIAGYLRQRKARKKPLVENDDGLFGGAPKRGVGLEWSNVGYVVRGEKSGLSAALAGGAFGFGRAKRQVTSRAGRPSAGTRNRVVLNNVSGRLPPGGFCCILGPSGAGKSTFVDILAGKRKGNGIVSGNVKLFVENGERSNGKHRIGFVDQSDILAPMSTVREALLFAAHLRLPENIPEAVKQERAHEVMQQLGLGDVADTRIGDVARRGISGGEMRRLSIGLELIAAPDILILDEPTSGLDSVSAANVIAVLQNLARDRNSPTTIIASIHQPSSRLYQSFDTVLLLSEGKPLYFGPGGTAPASYFGSKGYPCPDGYNIADHLLEIASMAPSESVGEYHYNPPRPRGPVHSETEGYPLTPMDSKRFFHIGSLATATRMTSLDKEGDIESSRLGSLPSNGGSLPSNIRHPEGILRANKACATTFLTQLQVLSGREWRNLKRDKSLLIAHIGLACILGVFAGGLYFKVDITISGFQNRVGSLFFLGVLLAFMSLSALYNLIEIRPLFLRERAASFYSPNAWLLSRIMFDIVPLRLIPIILVSTIVYWMVGLSPHADRFFKFLLILVEYGLQLTVHNFLLAALIRNGGIAILLSSLYNLFLMTYAGFFVNIGKIPPVLRWLRYFSTLNYALEALAVNEVNSGLLIDDVLAGVNVQVSASLIMETLFGFDSSHYYRDVLILFAFLAGYSGILVLTVWYWLKESR